jgi:hypothetical protein
MLSVENLRDSLTDALRSYLLRILHNLQEKGVRNRAELALQEERRERIMLHRGDPIADRVLTLYLWSLAALVVLCIIMNLVSWDAPVLHPRLI